MEANKNLEEKVFRIICDSLKIKRNEFNPDSKIEDLSHDSIQLFGLIIAFEKEFRHKTRYDDIIKIKTVGDIIKYLKGLNKHKI